MALSAGVSTPDQENKDVIDATVLSDGLAGMMIAKMGKKYTKFIPTEALKMDFPFSVQTQEGTMTGKAGDWLAMDAKGKFYPIDAETFSSTYRPARARTKNVKSSKKD